MARTRTFPSMEDLKIEEVITAAEAYEKSRDKRLRALTQELEDNATLVDVMKKHKLTRYRGPERLFVELASEEAKLKAKVRRVKEAEDEADALKKTAKRSAAKA
jgi:hypothetical protein